MLRGRRDDEHVRRYRLKQQLASIGDDFWIQDADGDRVYRVDGKKFRAPPVTRSRRSRSGRSVSATRSRSNGTTGRSRRCTRRSWAFGTASRSTSRTARTSRRTATSSTTSIRSNATATPWPPSPSAGSSVRDTYGVEIGEGGGRRPPACVCRRARVADRSLLKATRIIGSGHDARRDPERDQRRPLVQRRVRCVLRAHPSFTA
jgi:hypothetical protein